METGLIECEWFCPSWSGTNFLHQIIRIIDINSFIFRRINTSDMMWYDFLNAGFLMVLAGVAFIVLGILGKALLKVHGFNWVARAGIISILFGLVVLAYGYLTASFD
jgi:hypothetical protein